MTDHGCQYSEDIARVRARLLQLESTLAAEGHGQAWFVALYLATTTRCKWLVDGISQGKYDCQDPLRDLDTKLIRDIVVRLEPRYMERLISFNEGRLHQSDPWYSVFRCPTKLGPFAAMLLGAHTHIVFELPMVLSGRLDSGQRLYGPDNQKQVFTFWALNHWFAKDIGRAATRVCQVSKTMHCPTPALVGRLRCPRLRRWVKPVWKRILTRYRNQAAKDALLLQTGDLDEDNLASRVRENNLRLIHLLTLFTPEMGGTGRSTYTAVGTAPGDE